MKTDKKTVLLIAETVILVVVLIFGCFLYLVDFKNTELLREASPDEKYMLVIWEVGEADFPFGDDHIKVTLYEVTPQQKFPFYTVSFTAAVANDGAPASYQVEWLEDGVQIALIGEEQPTAYYVLPFKTLND